MFVSTTPYISLSYIDIMKVFEKSKCYFLKITCLVIALPLENISSLAEHSCSSRIQTDVCVFGPLVR